TVESGAGFTTHGYPNLLGLVFRVTGPSAWLPRCLNVVLGAAMAVLVYDLVLLIGGRRTAFIAGVGVALWPSLVLWSAVPLKYTFTLTALFAALLGMAHAARGRRRSVVVSVVAMFFLGVLRPYAFVVASIALLAGAAVRVAFGGLRRMHVTGVLIACVALLSVLGG